MKKFFVGVVLSVLLIANSALAGTFSQPVKIGEFYWDLNGGFFIKDAAENNGSVYTINRHNIQTYGRGTARFGDSNDSLYVHYNGYVKPFTGYFGAKNASNTIEIGLGETSATIYAIATNGLGNLYLIKGGGMTFLENCWFILLGRKNDGTFVKYFDTEDIHKRYFPQRFGYWFNDIKTQGDAIVVCYRRNLDGREMSNYSADEYGEFRFKWDERAQWFSVEQVIY